MYKNQWDHKIEILLAGNVEIVCNPLYSLSDLPPFPQQLDDDGVTYGEKSKWSKTIFLSEYARHVWPPSCYSVKSPKTSQIR